MTSDVSVVVCSKNAGTMLERCLKSIRTNGAKEVIVVDGSSTDGTREIAELHADTIVSDGRSGLGAARNQGLELSKGTYVVFVGPDNIMPEGSIKKMQDYLTGHDCAGVSAITVPEGYRGYIGWALSMYKRAKFTPGFKAVVGTPVLFPRDLLAEYRYDENMLNSDDTDLCTRMAENGHRFAISDAVVYEMGDGGLSTVLERWTRYGRGDYLYYRKYSKGWTVRRRYRSWMHPLVTDLIQPFRRIAWPAKIGVLPFLLLITALRYFGWVRNLVRPPRGAV